MNVCFLDSHGPLLFLELIFWDMWQVDPYLHLINDERLEEANISLDGNGTIYGSEEDDDAALSSLSSIERDDEHLKQIVESHLMKKFENLSKVNIRVARVIHGFFSRSSYFILTCFGSLVAGGPIKHKRATVTGFFTWRYNPTLGSSIYGNAKAMHPAWRKGLSIYWKGAPPPL